MAHTKLVQRLRRKAHTDKKIHGTAERPRLAVFRSNVHIYAQVIDDDRGATLAAASTLTADVKAALGPSPEGKLDKKGAAKLVGKAVGAKALAAGVTKVVFDRSGFQYHGRVAAVADGAREAGLDF